MCSRRAPDSLRWTPKKTLRCQFVKSQNVVVSKGTPFTNPSKVIVISRYIVYIRLHVIVFFLFLFFLYLRVRTQLWDLLVVLYLVMIWRLPGPESYMVWYSTILS